MALKKWIVERLKEISLEMIRNRWSVLRIYAKTKRIIIEEKKTILSYAIEISKVSFGKN